MGSRVPGPIGSRHSTSIDLGTLNRSKSIDPGLLGNSSAAGSKSLPMVVFFGGAWDADSLLGKLFISWKNEGHNNLKRVHDDYKHASHRPFFYTWDATKEAVNHILREAREDPQVPVCLVGHSFGGDTAIDVAEAVNAKGEGFGIELVVTLDAVSPGAHFQWQKAKPPNVYSWLNVYVKWELEWNNLVAQVGGHWGSQEQADSNIEMPDGVYHHQAYDMFETVKRAVWNFHLLTAPT